MGPNYHRPAVNVPAQFPDAPDSKESIADKKWFELFQDATLQQFVNTALEKNFDVRIAAERVIEARAHYGITRANLFPTLDAQAHLHVFTQFLHRIVPLPAGNAGRLQLYAGRSPAIVGARSVGQIAATQRRSRAQYLASEEARNGVIISLISDVMTTYFSLRELDLELEIGQPE